MTVKELREILAQYDDNMEVRLGIEDILDTQNRYITGWGLAERVFCGHGKDNIVICGKDYN